MSYGSFRRDIFGEVRYLGLFCGGLSESGLRVGHHDSEPKVLEIPAPKNLEWKCSPINFPLPPIPAHLTISPVLRITLFPEASTTTGTYNSTLTMPSRPPNSDPFHAHPDRIRTGRVVPPPRPNRTADSTKPQPQKYAVNSLKKRIRDLERQLRHVDTLPADVRVERERELQAKKNELGRNQEGRRRAAMIRKYHMVRFFGTCTTSM